VRVKVASEDAEIRVTEIVFVVGEPRRADREPAIASFPAWEPARETDWIRNPMNGHLYRVIEAGA
jgi:hypothetical protein